MQEDEDEKNMDMMSMEVLIRTPVVLMDGIDLIMANRSGTGVHQVKAYRKYAESA